MDYLDIETNNAPKTNIQLSATLEWNEVTHGEERDLISVINVQAPFYEAKTRSKLNLIAVIDRSGSMSGEKLELVKKTLLFMASQLKNSDQFCVVSFEDGVRVEFPLTEMNNAGRELATNKINALRTAGSTNLSGGLLEGITQAKTLGGRKETTNEVTSILLLTDGQANVGVSEPDKLVELVKQQLMGIDFPLSIFTFGYGSDHNETLLKNISTSSSGLYYFIENNDHIPKAFGDCIGGLLSVVAQNIRLNLEGMSGAIVMKPNVKYPLTEIANEMGEIGYSISIGDIYSEESKHIVCQLKLPKLDTPLAEQHILRCTLTYINLITSGTDTTSIIVKLGRPETVSQTQPNVEVDKQRNRLLTTTALEQADALGKTDQLTPARQTLQDAITKIQGSISGNDPYVQALIEELNEAKKRLVDTNTYITSGSKYMNSRSMNHGYERSSHSSPLYTNSVKRGYTQE